MSLVLVASVSIAEPLKIVCFGDSTTAPRVGVTTYCDSLAKEYAIRDRATVVNRGVPGNTTADARARFERDVLQSHPDLVFVMFGINDSTVDVWKTPPAVRPRVALDDFRANLTLFASTLKAAGARVVLLTFNPMHWTPKLRELYGKFPYQPDLPAGFEVGRADYLTVIRQVAREQNAELVDVRVAFTEYAAAPGHALEDLLLDGIHPNSAGQGITAGLVRPIVESALKQKGRQ